METSLENNQKSLFEIYQDYLKKFEMEPVLVNHKNYIEKNNLGFGEKPFHYMWKELVLLQPKNFKFLEIGVYKGQVLSLIKLLSDLENKNLEYYGVTPLSNLGDKYSSYENTDYKKIINSVFEYFNLDFSFEKNLIVGDSTSEKIKQQILDKKFFDLIYIDGGHDYNSVVSDIELVKQITKKNSYIVFDDSSCHKDLPNNLFKGHLEVCDALKSNLENDKNFIETLCVGHNRVFKRIL